MIKLTGMIQWCAGRGLTVGSAKGSRAKFAKWPAANIPTMAISRFQYDLMNTKL